MARCRGESCAKMSELGPTQGLPRFRRGSLSCQDSVLSLSLQNAMTQISRQCIVKPRNVSTVHSLAPRGTAEKVVCGGTCRDGCEPVSGPSGPYRQRLARIRLDRPSDTDAWSGELHDTCLIEAALGLPRERGERRKAGWACRIRVAFVAFFLYHSSGSQRDFPFQFDPPSSCRACSVLLLPDL